MPIGPAAHKDSEKMVKLASAAHKICGLDNVSVPFDMTLEAEVLGAKIEYYEGQIKWPCIKEFQFKDPSEIKVPKDVSAAGRVPVVVKAIKMLKEEFGGKVPVNAYLDPPFTTVSSYMVDTVRFFVWMKKDPEKIHQFLKTALDVIIEIAQLYQEAGADIITFHEMGAPTDNISPKHFEEFVVPYLKEIVKHVKVPTVLNICCSTKLIIDNMVGVGCSAIAIDERTPVSAAREIADKIKPGYPIIGNISARGVLFLGPPEKIEESVKRCIDEGIDMVAPGCDFWIETPTEHIKVLVNATRKYGAKG